MRKIDADALIAKIESLNRIAVTVSQKSLLGRVMYIVSKMPTSRPETKWISVKERLPEYQSPVLVYVPPYSDDEDEYTGYVGMAYYTDSANGGYWAGTDGNVYGAIGIIHKPTHWMQIPKPPNTEIVYRGFREITDEDMLEPPKEG